MRVLVCAIGDAADRDTGAGAANRLSGLNAGTQSFGFGWI